MKPTKIDEAKIDHAIDAMLSLYGRLVRPDAVIDKTQGENNRITDEGNTSNGNE